MAGLLDFLAGAAGPGMQDMLSRKDREQAAAAEASERAMAKAAEFAFREEQARLDRMARFGSDGESPGLLAGPRRASSGGGGSGGAFSIDGAREPAVVQLMQRGMTRPQAEQALDAALTGANPYMREQQVTEQIDDGDRSRTVTRSELAPDEERMARVARMVGEALFKGDQFTRGAKDADSVAKAENENLRTRAAQAAVEDPARAGLLAQGAIISKGGDLYGSEVNKGTGQLTELGSAERTLKSEKSRTEQTAQQENRAQAANASASAKKTNADRVSNRDDIRLLQQEKLSVEAQLKDLNQEANLLKDSLDPAAVSRIAEINAERASLRRQLGELTTRTRKMLDRSTGADGAAAPAQPAAPRPSLGSFFKN